MNVVVVVGVCEAIPVRAISFVTGWWMSPDKVATVLAQTDQFTKMRAISSYQLDQSGTPRKALPAVGPKPEISTSPCWTR